MQAACPTHQVPQSNRSASAPSPASGPGSTVSSLPSELSHVNVNSSKRPLYVVPFDATEDDRRRVGRRQERFSLGEMISASSARPACACRPASRPRPMPSAQFLSPMTAWPDKHLRARLARLDTEDVRALAVAGARDPRHGSRPSPFPADLQKRRSARPSSPGPERAGQSGRPASRCVPRPPPKTCPTLPSPASRRPSSTSSASRTCWHKHEARSSPRLYNDRAISYRVHKGYAPNDVVALSAGVQRMVRSDLGAAGVMFTIDTESGLRRRGLHHFQLRPGRDGGAGRGQPGRVLRPQADPEAPASCAVIRRNLGSKLIQHGIRFRRRPRRPPAASSCKTTDTAGRAAQPLSR